MKFKSTVIFAGNLAVLRRFWESILPLTVREDFGPCVVYEEGFSFWDKKHAAERTGGDYGTELYFEAENLDSCVGTVVSAGGQLIHPVTEQSWGQRVLRFLDPEGHLAEFGEPAEVFIGRMSREGLSPEAIASRTGYTEEQVLLILGPRIRKITLDEIPELLELQKTSYRREAELYDDWTIPPMTQTPEALREELTGGTEALGLYLGERLIGSTRGYLKQGTVYIGRVIVHPEYWCRGFGRVILTAMERHYPEARRAELFTGSKSLSNVRFYSGCGYEIFRTGPMGDSITLLYFEKALGG